MPVSCSWREVATTHYTLGGVRGEDGGEGSLVQRQAIALASIVARTRALLAGDVQFVPLARQALARCQSAKPVRQSLLAGRHTALDTGQ